MSWLVILGIAGVLFAMEFLLPGGILGLIAVFLIFIAAATATFTDGLATGFWVLFAGLVVTIGMFVAELKFLSSSRVAKWFRHSSQSTGTGREATTAPAELIGQRGHVISDLSPTGTVRVGEGSYTARSEGDYLTRGTEVEVIGQTVFHIVVRPLRSS
ncbi:MAG: NfeD family protein [Verrucomicrobiota bacterium JB022]|nr:NfeD family protein [Verrucomicrobiota bacterium JB022]